MKKNLGKLDRFIRVLLAALLGFLYLSGTVSGTWGLVLAGVGVILLVTSVISFCPIYAALGWSSRLRKMNVK